MKKRMISMLLAIVMVLGMLPATTLTAFAAAADSVWVGGVEMTNNTYLANGATATQTTKPSGGYAYYKDGTLTLNNYSYEGKGYLYNSEDDDYATVFTRHDLTVELVGTNTLTQTAEDSKVILVWGADLTVDGNGKLIATSKGSGLYATGNLTINGGTIAVTSYGTSIVANYDLTINGGNVTAISDNSYAIGGGTSLTIAKDLNIQASTTADGELGEYVAAKNYFYKKIVIVTPDPYFTPNLQYGNTEGDIIEGITYVPNGDGTFNANVHVNLNCVDGQMLQHEWYGTGYYWYDHNNKLNYGIGTTDTDDLVFTLYNLGENLVPGKEWRVKVYLAYDPYCDDEWREVDFHYVTDTVPELKPEDVATPEIYVGGVGMYNGNYLAVGATATQTTKPSGGYAYYKDGKLTLNNYSYEGEGYKYDSRDYYATVYANQDLTVELVGTNTLKQTKTYSEVINVYIGNLTIQGDGSLNATAPYDGIYASKTITVSGGTIISTGSFCGMRSYDQDIIINGGTVTVSGYYGLVSKAGSVKINGGNVTATGSAKAISYGTDNGENGSFTVAKGMKIQASTTADGELGEYVAANHDSYKKIVVKPVNTETIVSPRVESILSEMTLEEKITQMMMVDFRKWGTTADTATDFTEMNEEVQKIIEDYNFGSIILFANNIKETEQSYNLTMAMQEAATKDGGIALIICADQEGGNVYRLGSGTALPGNMALGATYAANGTKYAYEAGKIIGSELDAVGINGNLAPVVDVNNNANNPVIGLRSYGDDATMVGELASASIAGMAEYNVIGTAKHFPGHGDTATDSHYGLPIVDKSLDVLMETELKPYTVAIDEGIEMIMTAHILYPQLESDKIVSNKSGKAESLPATMSDDILTYLLKGEMGFDGIIVTDAMNMAGISANWDEVQSCVIAIQAGVDLICMPTQLYCKDQLANLDKIIDGIIAAVEDGTIPMERINDAVARILTVKENRGILDYDPAEHTLEKAKAVVGCAANREMERELAAAAVTVIKNEDNVLPLNITKDSKVLMMVPYNNERAQMLMAWNRAKEAGLIPEGAQVDYVTFSKTSTIESLKEKMDWADTLIINSEISATSRYNPTGSTYWLYNIPNQICDYAAANGKIAVISSVDKPYDVQMYANANAIVAAYGCKGSSVDPTEALIGGATGSEAAYGPNIIAAVEVILGTFKAQGKLPVNIPVLDMAFRTYTDEIAYERGYGLTYDALIVENPFTDVKKGDFFYDPVMWAVQNGITTGATATTFNPGGNCLRAHVVTFLYRAEGNPEPTKTNNPFKDVTSSDFFYKPVLWAVEKGITNGTSATTFGSFDTCNRAAVVTFLWRAQGSPEPTSTNNPFVDVKSTDFFYKAVLWAVENGITNGIDATHFGPTTGCNRAQVVTFLYRAYK